MRWGCGRRAESTSSPSVDRGIALGCQLITISTGAVPFALTASNSLMAQLEKHTCQGCGKSHDLHRHRVSLSNRGSLGCPICQAVLVAWDSSEFYTLAITPPSSSPDIPVIGDLPPDSPN